MPEVSIRSTRFGSVSVADEAVLNFPEGLVGLPELNRFAMSEPGVKGSPFKYLISLDDPEVGFAVADPGQLFSDYEVDLASECEVLGITGDEDMSLLVMLNIPADPIRTTANLLAPIIINIKTKLARQLVLSDSRYSTRHPIIAPRPAV